MTTTHINVGARIAGDRPASKAALKRALTTDPHTVVFDATSMFHTGPATMTPQDLTEGVVLDVVGPDPATNRRFYASVTRSAAGKIRLS